MNKTVLILVIILVLSALPLSTGAVTFVNCGQETRDPSNNAIISVNQCDFSDLIDMILAVINYLITVAAVVAMYHVLLSGFNLISSVGNPEKIQKAKGSISNAVVGFAIIVLAFVFVNLLVNGLFGDPTATRPWWNPACIYNISGTKGVRQAGTYCPLGSVRLP